MIQRGQHHGFALKAGESVSVGSKRRGKNLQRHIATEFPVAGAVHLAHPPGAERLEDFVVADPRARIECHLTWAAIVTGFLTAQAKTRRVRSVSHPISPLGLVRRVLPGRIGRVDCEKE